MMHASRRVTTRCHKIKNGDKASPLAYRDYYIFTVIHIHRPRLQRRQALVPCNSPRLYSDISASALVLGAYYAIHNNRDTLCRLSNTLN